MTPLIGQTLGQYQIIEQIGQGGMATVYKAYQPALDRYVAVKVLPAYFAHEPGFAERFTREAQAIAQLDHPNILPIHDFGKHDNISYIVMKYVPAGSLKDKLGQPLSPLEASRLIDQIAGALDAAHERGILHRDVKPGNILLDDRGWVYLSDFGLAKIVEGSIQLTGTGVGVGTPAYMSPEQGQGLPVDARTDVYALGVILFEMLTGHVPYTAETPVAVVIKHVSAPIPLARQENPNLPEAVERVLLKALAKDREARFATAGALAVALRQAVQTLDPRLAAAPLPIDREATLLHPGGPFEPVSSAARAGAPPVAPQTSPTWLPLAAIIGGLGLIGGGGLLAGLLFFNSAAAPSPTPGPSPTAVPGSSPAAVVEVAIVPTATATPSPTLTRPAPTPTPTPPPETAPAGTDPGAADVLTLTVTREPSPTPSPPPTPTLEPTATPLPVVCASEPQGEFRHLWMRHKERLGCPHQTNPIGGFFAEQLFQNGHMFWSQEGRLFLVVMGGDWGSWRLFPEDDSTWKEGMPPYSCSVEVPAGLIQPVRGFGGIWCAQPDIRERLGFGLADERGFENSLDLIQGFDGGLIFRDSDGQTQGLAYVLFGDDGSYVREGY